MSARTTAIILLLALALTGCFQPPYNNFLRDRREIKQVSTGAVIGAGAGALVGALAGSTGVGIAIGAVAGGAIGLSKSTKRAILLELQKQDIMFIEYGDTVTLIIPTDRYYLFNSPQLNDICYPGLNNIIRLLKFYPCSLIYVAGFTDDVGSRRHNKLLSQARAEAMLTFLWAHNINAKRLHAEGYGEKHAVGDNIMIRGSAYNRRVELQWLKGPKACAASTPYMGAMKE